MGSPFGDRYREWCDSALPVEEGESRYRRLARKAANAFCAIIAFASAARALKAARYVNDINPEAIAEFLESGFLPDSCFVYEGAIKLPSASILKWCDAKVSTWQYWQPLPITLVRCNGLRSAYV